MGQRTEALARRIEEANAEIVAFAETCPEDDWRRRPEGDEWTVGVIAHHVANGYDQEGRVAGFVQAVMRDEPLPPPPPRGYNDPAPDRFARFTRDETIDLLRRNGAAAARLVRELQDADLERLLPTPADRPPRTLGHPLEYVFVGHVYEHLMRMRSATRV
jgi:hypothetical protein